jgi:hypothetical protein
MESSHLSFTSRGAGNTASKFSTDNTYLSSIAGGFHEVALTRFKHPKVSSDFKGKMYICCNLVEPPEEGDPDFFHVLRSVDFKEKKVVESNGTIKFDDDIYFPVWKHIPQRIEIRIKNIDGDLFPFDGGNSGVTLHIRRCKTQSMM